MNAQRIMATSPVPGADDALLAYYEALETASQDMVRAARDRDWSRVAQIRTHAGRVIAQLRIRLEDDALDRHDTRRKLRIMQRIVRHDAELRFLAQPWLRGLDALLRGRGLH